MKAIIIKGQDRGKRGSVVGVYMDGRADIRVNRRIREYARNEWCWE